MGLFDRMMVPCPDCGYSVEFQSKADDCNLISYSIDTAPPSILADLDGQAETCPKCSRVVRFRIVPAGWRGIVE